MFWWLQPFKQIPVKNHLSDTPVILWLQGGPGASGTGFGQFTEIGPYGTDWTARPYAWTNQAHVLFVDSPVGTGFSYVEDGGSFAATNPEIGRDLVALLKGVAERLPWLRTAPLLVACESYGGKMGAAFVSELLSQGNSAEIANLRGLALGDSWIDPISYVLAWGPLLRDMSLLDANGYETVMEAALDIQSSVSKGRWEMATESWAAMEALIESLTDNVDFYHLLRHNSPGVSGSSGTHSGALEAAAEKMLRRYGSGSLAEFMNGEVRDILGDIPSGVTWGGQAGEVFRSLKADFMRSAVEEVDNLLKKGVNITVYNGQLDLICCTRGTEAWMKMLTWSGMRAFYGAPRQPLYPPGTSLQTGAFLKRQDNFAVYHIMEAGHMVPSDVPLMASEILSRILWG